MTGQDLQSIGIIWLWRVSQYPWAECLGMCNNNHGSQHIASTFPLSRVSLHVLSVTFFPSLISVLDLEMTRTYSLYRWGTGTQNWWAGCFGCACHPKAPKLGSWSPYCSGTLKGWVLRKIIGSWSPPPWKGLVQICGTGVLFSGCCEGAQRLLWVPLLHHLCTVTWSTGMFLELRRC